MSVSEFYRLQLKDTLRYAQETRKPYAITAYNQTATELDWHNKGRPYYKIYPALLPMFLKTKLDVPGKYLHAPFSSLVIRLPENHQCNGLIAEGKELRSILVTEVSKEQAIAISGPIQYEHMFILWMNFGEIFDGMPYYIFQTLKFRSEESIESALSRQRTPEKTDTDSLQIGVQINDEIINNCVRLTVSVCFLATGADRIVEPDVLSKDLERFITARKEENHSKITSLHQKAKKRGKHGWTLGREIRIPSKGCSTTGAPTGHHLTYQHQRGAHFHVYHYGAGKALWKVRWIRQTTVRADLPLPPVQTKKGYIAK